MGTGVTHREQKGVRVVPQLLDQALLQFRRGAGSPHRREQLNAGEVQVPAEAQANHIDVLLAIAEGTCHRDKHWKGDERRLGLPVPEGGRATAGTVGHGVHPVAPEGVGAEKPPTQSGHTLVEKEHLALVC